MTISLRLKAGRAALGLTQEDVVTISGIPMSTYRKYEGGSSAPGAEALAGIVRAGINANWLLTGEGPMLLADLVPPAVEKPPRAQINAEGLAQSLSAMLASARPGETQAMSARKAVQFYIYMEERGFLTPDGFSPGEMDSAA